MEALESQEQEKPRGVPNIDNILHVLRTAECRTYPSVGSGTDIRLHGHGVVGAGLANEGQVLHLSLFSHGEVDGKSRMAPPSRRRTGPHG